MQQALFVKSHCYALELKSITGRARRHQYDFRQWCAERDTQRERRDSQQRHRQPNKQKRGGIGNIPGHDPAQGGPVSQS